MKAVFTIARLLLALIFLVFGSNIFFHFINMGPPPGGLMGHFYTALGESHYLEVVGVFQVLGAILILMPRTIPLGLTILGPIVVNILLTHIFLAPQGLPVAIVTAILWFLTFIPVRAAFAGIFTGRP